MQKAVLFLLIGLVITLAFHVSYSDVSPIGIASTSAPNTESPLLEIGQATKIRSTTQLPTDLKVVSYNIRWRGGEDLLKLAHLLKADFEIGGASILGLQEG